MERALLSARRMKTLLPVLFVIFSACGPDLPMSQVQFTPDALELSLGEDEAGCRVLAPDSTALVDGAPALIEFRGGGECQQVRVGSSLITLVPGDPNATQRVCACKPARIKVVTDEPKPLELKVCSGSNCMAANWPAPPEAPRLEVQREDDGWFFVRAIGAPPNSVEASVQVVLRANGNEVSSSTQYRDRDYAAQSFRAKPAETDTNVYALLHWRHEDKATHCDFWSCWPRPTRGAAEQVRLK